MPKISIIVPVYNVEEYLTNCIESLLNQTFKDFELILVNDGSTDNSLEICKKYKNIDNRICIVDKKNGGLSSARNAGLDVAKGDYIGFIDSDDYVHPEMYEILYKKMVENSADISLCNFKKVYNYDEELLKNNKNIEQKILIESMSNIEALEKMDEENGVVLIVAWNKLYKRDLFRNLRYKHGAIHEDEFIVHRILYDAKKVIYVNEQLYFYMQRDGSIMNNITKITRIDYLLALSDRIKFFNEKGLKHLQYKYEETYLYEIFRVYPNFERKKNYIKKLLLRIDFLKLINILKKNPYYSFKEKIVWVIFCLAPNLYINYKTN